MRNLNLLFLFIISIIFISCGDDDNPLDKWKGSWNNQSSPGYPKFDLNEWPDGYNPLLGEWRMTEFNENKTASTFILYWFDEEFNLHISEKNYEDDFYPNYVGSSFYQINDEQFMLLTGYGGKIFEYTISTDNMQLTIKDDDNTYIFVRYIINDNWQ